VCRVSLQLPDKTMLQVKNCWISCRVKLNEGGGTVVNFRSKQMRYSVPIFKRIFSYSRFMTRSVSRLAEKRKFLWVGCLQLLSSFQSPALWHRLIRKLHPLFKERRRRREILLAAINLTWFTTTFLFSQMLAIMKLSCIQLSPAIFPPFSYRKDGISLL